VDVEVAPEGGDDVLAHHRHEVGLTVAPDPLDHVDGEDAEGRSFSIVRFFWMKISSIAGLTSQAMRPSAPETTRASAAPRRSHRQ